MTDPTRLAFLPRPWRVERGNGDFRLDAATRIQIGPGASTETLHSARQIQNSLRNETSLELPVEKTSRPVPGNAITLIRVGRDETAIPAVSFGWITPADQDPQGYTLRVSDAGATVAASDEPGLFYGVQTLIQLQKLCGRVWPGVVIHDRPALPMRGVMLDVSRMKVPRLDTLIELVETLAHYKYNQFQLYIEHTFRFPSHPKIGADAGSYTVDDILTLDAICRELHIELVPNLQSLGHLRSMLSLAEYEDLAETPWKWTLATEREEPYKLLDELYGDFLPAFSSSWFNIDADEPWDLGRGQSSSMTEQHGIGRVYLNFILKAHQLVRKHDHKMMMWADVVNRHPELIPEIPHDIMLLDWWYEKRDRYDTVDAIAKSGRPFMVCPGTSSWSTLYPRLDNAIANIKTFVHDGIEAGTAGMLLTDWGDGGHYQTLSNSWYPYLWGAETAWTGCRTSTEEFDQAFSTLFLGDISGQQTAAMRRLGATMQISPVWTVTWNTAVALFEDPVSGALSQGTPRKAISATADAADAIFPLLSQVRDPRLRADLGFAAAQIAFAANKVQATQAIRALLKELADHPTPTADGLAQFDDLIAMVKKQRDALPAMITEFENRWLAHARPSEIDFDLQRFDRLVARYDAALAWLGQQRAAYEAGKPVDADLSSYDTGGYAVIFEESWKNIEALIELIGFDALPDDVKGWISVRPRPEVVSAD